MTRSTVSDRDAGGEPQTRKGRWPPSFGIKEARGLWSARSLRATIRFGWVAGATGTRTSSSTNTRCHRSVQPDRGARQIGLGRNRARPAADVGARDHRADVWQRRRSAGL